MAAPIGHVPAAGELVLADHLSLSIGGCASNTAVDLARVGVDVAVVGCVGRDVFGRFVIETLSQAGVDARSVRELDGIGTSGTLIVNVEGQDRRFIHTIGANARFTAADIPLDRVRAAKILYVGGYVLMPSLDPAELADVFRQARAWGVTTILDIVLPGPGDHWSRLAPYCARPTSFCRTRKRQPPSPAFPIRGEAERFRAAGVRTAVITCGGQGTVLVADKLRLRRRRLFR